MSQGVSLREPVRRTFTAAQEVCPHEGSRLWIVQHRVRTVHRLDETVEATFRDKGCPRGAIPGYSGCYSGCYSGGSYHQ